jgi:hypothetical protein
MPQRAGAVGNVRRRKAVVGLPTAMSGGAVALPSESFITADWKNERSIQPGSARWTREPVAPRAAADCLCTSPGGWGPSQAVLVALLALSLPIVLPPLAYAAEATPDGSIDFIVVSSMTTMCFFDRLEFNGVSDMVPSFPAPPCSEWWKGLVPLDQRLLRWQ